LSTKEISAIKQLAQDWKTKVGQIYTSKDISHLGPAYLDTTFNTEVTRDAILHFVDGIGDLNRLYRDEEYAKNTKYKCLVAPPTFIYTINCSQYPEEWPVGIRGYYSGSVWEWFRPLCKGDEITFTVMYPSDIELKSGKFAGDILIEYLKGEYYRQGGELIAVNRCWVIWAEEKKAIALDKYQNNAKIPEYSVEDLKKIYASQDREGARGAEARYWEDTEVGEELSPIVRGPYTLSEKIAYLIGARGNHNRSDRLSRLLGERQPHLRTYLDPALKKYLDLVTGHIDESLDTKAVPRRWGPGEQVEVWLSMVITNWIGDDGFLWKSKARIRGFLLEGDATWCKGKVSRKYCDDGKYCVDIGCWCENQTGEMTVSGEATVVLPSREHGPVVYPSPHYII
jgi:acyl dehydratase